MISQTAYLVQKNPQIAVFQSDCALDIGLMCDPTRGLQAGE